LNSLGTYTRDAFLIFFLATILPNTIPLTRTKMPLHDFVKRTATHSKQYHPRWFGLEFLRPFRIDHRD
jgi:hypothetical protein